MGTVLRTLRKAGGIFCGVGGGTTRGLRTIALAKNVESQGAMGVVLNAPIDNLILMAVANAVDIPVIVTVVDEKNGHRRADRGGGQRHHLYPAHSPGAVQNHDESIPGE